MKLLHSRHARVVTLMALIAGGVASYRLFWKHERELRREARSGSGNPSAHEFAALIGADISRSPLQLGGAADYVSTDACAACHEEIAKAFDSHPMRNSMAPIASATPVENY